MYQQFIYSHTTNQKYSKVALTGRAQWDMAISWSSCVVCGDTSMKVQELCSVWRHVVVCGDTSMPC